MAHFLQSPPASSESDLITWPHWSLTAPPALAPDRQEPCYVKGQTGSPKDSVFHQTHFLKTARRSRVLTISHRVMVAKLY